MDGKSIRRVFVMSSKDDGNTWSESKNITDQANPGGTYNWLAIGPGVGIHLENEVFREVVDLTARRFEISTMI